MDFVKERKLENGMLFQNTISAESRESKKQTDNDQAKNNYINTDNYFRNSARR
jgi:hypothetical protein